ncbi:MAG: hypoxanthine phosphoribosyltransferase [Clostridia bacterium]|nr:hypoxanthine phosphoribosyltransferase [Clostridia bacterium]
MKKDFLEKVLINEEEIGQICKRLGAQITEDYKDKNLLLVGILKGSVPFLADLIKNIDLECEIDFMSVSSYEGTKTTGRVAFKKDLDINPEGRDILIVEDILDSGLTLSYLKSVLEVRSPASVKICTLLDKPENRKAEIEADYVGKVIPNEFVIGYGLDYNEKYRNLSYVGVLSPKIYSE